MSDTVTVICKLPCGFEASVGNKIVQFNGINKTQIIGAKEGYTEVDKEFWDAWYPANKNRSWCTSQAITMQAKEKDARAKAKELRSVKTGMEPVVPVAGKDE